jgi:hypothetical protein
MSDSAAGRASGPVTMRGGRPRTIGPPSVIRATFLGLGVLFGLMGAAALVTGIAAFADSQPVGGVASLGGGLVLGGIAWMMWRLTRSRAAALVLRVAPDALVFNRRDERAETVRRDEVGLVVIQAFGRAGVGAYEVYGPDRSLIGRWDTGGSIGPGAVRPMRALRHFAYPWVLHDSGAIRAGSGRLRSPLAPAWTDEIVNR